MPWQVEQLALNFCSPSRNSAGAEATVPVPFGSAPFWLHDCAAPRTSTTRLTHNIRDDFIVVDRISEGTSGSTYRILNRIYNSRLLKPPFPNQTAVALPAGDRSNRVITTVCEMKGNIQS